MESVQILPLEKQEKLSEERLRAAEAMIKLRFSSSNWDEPFKRFRDENGRRMG